MVTIFVVLLGVTAVALAIAWRADSSTQQLKQEQAEDRVKIAELGQRVDSLKINFVKILAPIRQNAEDIDLLDDDLMRIQGLVDELKKREKADEPPPAAKS